jgi:hypothetical protein
MEVSGQLHAPVDPPPVPIWQKAWYAPRACVDTVEEKKKSCTIPASRPVARRCTDSAIPNQIWFNIVR